MSALFSLYSLSTFARALRICVPMALLGAAVPPAMADEALAKAKNCMACHALDKKMVGPAYKDVAAKFGGQKDAEATLVKAIIEGPIFTR